MPRNTVGRVEEEDFFFDEDAEPFPPLALLLTVTRGVNVFFVSFSSAIFASLLAPPPPPPAGLFVAGAICTLIPHGAN